MIIIKNKILVLILTILIILSASPISSFAESNNSMQFTDLTGYESYNDYVMYTSVYNNYILGTNPPEYTVFSPKTILNRAMLITIIYRMAGSPYNGCNPYKYSPFTDVKDTTAYYYNAICWALDKDITNQLTFKPYDNVLREQAAAFLFRYAESENYIENNNYLNINLKKYHDCNDIKEWSAKAFQWADYTGMFTGTQQGMLNPQGYAQRIHISKILYGFGTACHIGNYKPLPYEPIHNAMLLAKNKDTVTNEKVELFALGRITNLSKNEWTTKTGNEIISKEMLYFPYGSVVKIDNLKLKEMGYISYDFRMYRYSESGEYLGEINASYLCPDGSIDDDVSCKNFTVTEPDGIFVRIRWVKWENSFTANTAQHLQSAFTVYSLTDINAEIFDNKTIIKCWNNEMPYEAWPTKCIFFNPNNNLYYAFYPSQSAHVVYDGKLMFRTSADLINWSDSKAIWKSAENDFSASMDGALLCPNGDILISMICQHKSENNNYIETKFLKSSDNGLSWETVNFILDGKDATGKYRLQRAKALDNGRIFANYFDSDKKEKAGICYSDDNGQTWVSSDFSSKYKLTDNGEYDFVKLNNGNILCIQRIGTDGIGISAAISTDNGKSFINETPLNFIDKNGQMQNCPIIRYDKNNDRLTIYEIDRFKSGALVGIYTSGKNFSEFLLYGTEFKGFQANACPLGINGNTDMGYPHIIDAPDGTVKCFYYNRTNGTANTASWYCLSTI